MKSSLLIGIEEYADPQIRAVPFAAADARGLAAALADLGIDESHRGLLVDAQATKTVVESRLRQTIRTLTAEDVLYVFYAGHGFSHSGQSFLTCHDTQLADLEATSIPLAWLVGLLQAAGSPRVVLFLDAGERGLLATPAMWETYGDLADDELKAFFDPSERGVCFVACQPGEESWPSGQLQHGIWAYHLIEAFAGNAPLALEGASLLTPRSLQKHLQQSLAPTLRATYADPKQQTPWACGALGGELVLADLSGPLAKRQAGANFDASQVTRLALRRRQTGELRRLAGFRKGFHVPEHASAAAEAFVAKIAEEEILADIAAVQAQLRGAFKFKRAELQVGHSGDGTASIITPHFTYTVRASLNPENSSEVVWDREINDIHSPAQILGDPFAAAFAASFDTVEFSFPGPIPLAELIDRVEQRDDDRLTIDYDHALTWCKLAIQGIAGEIRVTARTFQVVQRKAQPPRLLLQSFFDIQRALIETHDIRLVPFGD